MPGERLFEIRLHLHVLVYTSLTWSANPHMERVPHVDELPIIGAPLTVDETAVTARVKALEAAGWTRGVRPHVRTHTGEDPGSRG